MEIDSNTLLSSAFLNDLKRKIQQQQSSMTTMSSTDIAHRNFIVTNEANIRQTIQDMIEANITDEVLLFELLELMDNFNESVLICVEHFANYPNGDNTDTFVDDRHYMSPVDREWNDKEKSFFFDDSYVSDNRLSSSLLFDSSSDSGSYESFPLYQNGTPDLYDQKMQEFLFDDMISDEQSLLVVDDDDMEVINLDDDDIEVDVSDGMDVETDSYIYEDFIHENFEEIECPICFDMVAPGEGYLIKPCAHSYCKDCLDGYFSNAVLNNNVMDIHCPTPGCESLCGYNDIQTLCSEEIFAKYQDFTFYAALNQDQNVKWCTNPEGCGNAVIAEPNEMKVVCTTCKYEFCFECGEEYHTGTCAEYEQWKIDNGRGDAEFKAWERQFCKPCPNCKIRIQKNDGCNHITCGHCGHQWCWLCNGKYTSNHYDIYNVLGCPGLQFKGGNSNKGLGKSIGMKVLVGTGIVVGGAIALPFALIGGAVFGGIKLGKHIKKQSRR